MTEPWMRAGVVADKVAIIAMTDLEGTIIYANDLFVEISGYSREELIGANHRILNSGHHPESFFLEMYRMISAGQPWRGEVRNRAKDGSYYWVDTHIIPSFDSDGKRQGYTAVRFDITERKKTEEALNAVSSLQAAILDHAGYAIISTQRDGTISTFNRAAEEMLGYSKEEMVGRAKPDVFHCEDELVAEASRLGAKLGRKIEPAINVFFCDPIAQYPLRTEWSYVRKDGRHIPVLLSVTALRDSHGVVTGFLGIAADISEQREYEARLERIQEELKQRLTDLEQANERIAREAARQVTLLEELAEARDDALAANTEKSRFLAMMSHEIRTPMNGVAGILGLLQSTDLNAEQAKLVATASRSAADLIQLTTDILDLSKLEAHKTELEIAPINLADMSGDVCSLLRPAASAKALELKSEIAPSVPEYIMGDAHRIRQVLINLLSNAIKFTLKGSVTLSVAYRPQDAYSGRLKLKVSDTGIGLDRAAIDRLFKNYMQAEQSTSRRFGGTGLGLAICKQLTELMGGEIGVESTFGAGSTFWVSLPVDVGEALNVSESMPVESPSIGLKLLVAEDNSTNQMLMQAILGALGHEVTLANNGAEALELAKDRTFDAILMDIQMPIMDGPTATREIRRSGSPGANVPIVALTANAMPGDRESYIAAGMDEYVTKPVDPAKLSDALQRAVRGGHRPTGN